MTALDEAPVLAPPGRTDDVVLAERTVLASMITFRDAAERVLEILDRDDCFADQVHRAVYAAIRHVAEEGAVTGREPVLDDDGKPVPLMQQRFAAVLSRLVAAEHGIWRTGQAGVILTGLMRYASPGYLTDAAKVLQAAIQRRTVEAIDAARELAVKPGFDAERDGDAIHNLIGTAMSGAPGTAELVTAADLFLETLERMEAGEAPGVIRFPWRDLRDIIPWLRPGQLVSILARPSVGKSLLAGDLARFTGLHEGFPVALFTMEMSRDEVMDRLIAAESGVLHKRIVEGDLDDAAWDKIAATQERFAGSKLFIDDTPRVTPAHIRARLRGLARREPARLAIIDYLQLMAPPQADNRQQEVAALVGSLKAIAREFRIPVVMLAQLNRGPEHRQDKTPHLSDARESGSVENDSDVAILIHRPDMYDSESARAGEADLIVAKNRNGARSTVTVGCQAHYSRFVDLAWSPSAKGE